MKIISSTGTKGGVGKSTFAILLAYKFFREGKRVVLGDLDVECPNDHLLMGKELQDPQPIYQAFPTLNKEKCEQCGVCANTCRENAIFWVKGDFPQFLPDLCSGCGACWLACPYDAIETEDEITGESFITKIQENFWLVTGRSEIGVIETGPLVREVKARALKLAHEQQVDYLLVDTAPGTHCSVINALMGSDKAYAVTEPTPLGAHDLQLILQLLQKLEVPTEIVLNRADVGDKTRVQEIAEKFGKKIVIEIPYSVELVKAYASQNLGEMVGLL